MPTRRRFAVVLAATLAVAGAVGLLAPTVSAAPATAGALDTPRPDMASVSAARVQPEVPPPERWNRTYGSDAGDLAAVAVDSRGFVAAGTMLTQSGTSNSGWVVAVDPAGDVRFRDTYATDGEGRFNDVVTTADGGYLLVGTLDSGNTAADDGWVLKVDATGSVVWQETVGGAGDDTFAAIEPTEDGYLLAGTEGSGSDTDGWLVKVTTGGRVQWDGSYDNDFDDRIRDIAPHPGGGYLLAGETTAFVGARTDGWTVHVEADGSELEQRTYGGARTDGFSAVETLGGDLLLAGVSNTYGTDDRRGWVLRRGPNSTERWNRTYDVDGTEALAVRGDGFLLAGIETTDVGTRDGVLLGAGTDGETAWRRTYGRANDDLLSDVLVGPNGGYLLGGTSYSGPGDGTGWLVALGTVLQPATPTPTATPETTAGPAPTTAPGTVTSTAGSGGSTPNSVTTASGATTTVAGSAVAGATTTTNASAAGSGGTFPWTIVALFLIVIVLGGVFLAIRSQQVGDRFGIGSDDGSGPSPPGDDDPTFGTPSGESRDTQETTSKPTSRGTPRDADPLGTNARSPGEAAKLFLASLAAWARVTLPVLDAPRATGDDESAGHIADQMDVREAGTTGADTGDERAGSADDTATTSPEGELEGATSGTATAATADTTDREPDTADEGSASVDDRAETGTPESAPVAAGSAAGGGEPGTFTLRNPGDEDVVVAFRCQTADETLFNYYAEVPPGTIKRAKKLPAEDLFEITIAITDGPSETRRFQNEGPNGQDVTVTVAPDAIRMETTPGEQQGDTAIRVTVEPEAEQDEETSTRDEDTTAEVDEPDTDSSTDGPAESEQTGTDSKTDAEPEDGATSPVSDDPGDVLPSVDETTDAAEDADEPAVGADPDDVLPSADAGIEDAGEGVEDAGDGADSDTTAADAEASAAESGTEPAGGDEAGPGDSGESVSGFQALKDEFESGEADWADEDTSGDATDDAEGADSGSDDPFEDTDSKLDDLGLGEQDDQTFDDDVGLEGTEFDDGLGLDDTDELDDSGAEAGDESESDESESAGSGESSDDGETSFAELKEEFESGDAEWADEDGE